MFNLDASSLSIKIKETVLAISPIDEPPTMYYLCDLVINLQACHVSGLDVVGIRILDQGRAYNRIFVSNFGANYAHI